MVDHGGDPLVFGACSFCFGDPLENTMTVPSINQLSDWLLRTLTNHSLFERRKPPYHLSQMTSRMTGF